MADLYKLNAAAIAVYPMYRGLAHLAGMELLRKGSRLSIQPVSAEEWDTIMDLARGRGPR